MSCANSAPRGNITKSPGSLDPRPDHGWRCGRTLLARVPDGASLISNDISLAPGFQLGNVFVLAGAMRLARFNLGTHSPGHGWFMGVRSFAYSPGVGSVPSRFAAAYARWLLFLAFWAVASVLLPAALVALAFVGWVVWIGRDIKRTLGGLDIQEELVAET